MSSDALCRCLLTAIVSAVRCRAMHYASIFRLLLFQQPEVERCPLQMPAKCYCFSSSKALCADIFWLLLLQQPEVERAFVTASSRCYCFSSLKTNDALCRLQIHSHCYCFSSSHSSTRATLCADIFWLLFLQLADVERYICELLLLRQSELYHVSNQARVQVDGSCADDNVCSQF